MDCNAKKGVMIVQIAEPLCLKMDFILCVAFHRKRQWIALWERKIILFHAHQKKEVGRSEENP